MTSSRLGKPEKEFKRELSNDQKLVLLYSNCHVTSHKTFLFLVSLSNISCSCHVTDCNIFLFLVALLNISCSSHVMDHKTFLFLVTLLNISCVTVM